MARIGGFHVAGGAAAIGSRIVHDGAALPIAGIAKLKWVLGDSHGTSRGIESRSTNPNPIRVYANISVHERCHISSQ